MATSTLSVTGMHCTSCSMLIDETLEEMSGVVSASTDLRRESTSVEFDSDRVSLEAIAAEIAKLGYTARRA